MRDVPQARPRPLAVPARGLHRHRRGAHRPTALRALDAPGRGSSSSPSSRMLKRPSPSPADGVTHCRLRRAHAVVNHGLRRGLTHSAMIVRHRTLRMVPRILLATRGVELREGVSQHAVSARMGFSRVRVRKYPRAPTGPARAPRRTTIGMLRAGSVGGCRRSGPFRSEDSSNSPPLPPAGNIRGIPLPPRRSPVPLPRRKQHRPLAPPVGIIIPRSLVQFRPPVPRKPFARRAFVI
ncbi:MAG: hypothetical protein JWM10_2339 [Myxococcaceae bacterium]|nr:hypothetical protein [Myxococcaceae bacterium]